MTPTKRIFCGLLILVSSSALAKGETPTNHHVATTIIENLEECFKEQDQKATTFMAMLGGGVTTALSMFHSLKAGKSFREPTLYIGGLIFLSGLGLNRFANKGRCLENMDAAHIEDDAIVLWNSTTARGLKCLVEYDPDNTYLLKTHFDKNLTVRRFKKIDSAINIKYDTCHAIEVLD